MRNLTNTLAVLLLVLPASAHPLGIGEIKLHSTLNQKLDAEIDLILSENETISDIQVRLAAPEKFDEAGVPWNYFLSKIKFTPVEHGKGSAIVKLSSTEILREPFLDFLVEVSWAKGNLFREFTVLVDPPASYNQPIIPVIQNANQEVKTWDSLPVKAANVVYETLASHYGPTDSSDSLWKVADKTNIYEDVSIEQMMMAIYQANPNAFFKKNVNALMAQKVLEIPDREVLLQFSQKQAMTAFNKQNIAWKGRVEANNQEQQSVIDNFENNAQLELEAPVEAEINDAVVVISETEMSDLDVIRSESEKQSALASESVVALHTRMEKLEQQLEMMQKSLMLKDEQIAALLNQKKLQAVSEPDNIQASLKEDKVHPIQEQKILKPVVDVGTSTEIKTEESLKLKTVEKITEKIVEKPKQKAKVKAKPVVQQESDTGNYLTLILSSLGVAILGLLGFFWWHRNKDVELSEAESMFASASEISMPDSAVEDSSVSVVDDTSYDVGTVGESSFLSEFTPSDFDAFDTDQDEIDPISEADVYLAYGRYQQAEDLIRQAISSHPGRDECKLKLLEIFYANENKTAFLEYAEELVSAEKHNDHDFWKKVIEMGAELDPDSSLFALEAGGKANFDKEIRSESSESIITYNAEDNAALEEGSNEDFKIDNSNIIDEAIIPMGQAVDENTTEMDFDLSGFDSNEDQEKQVDEVKIDENNIEMDFDLSSFDIDESTVDRIGELDESTNEVEAIDFDLTSVGLSDSPDMAEPEELIEEQSDDISLDFDLSIFDQQETADEQKTANSNGDTKLSNGELESVEFDLTTEQDLKDESVEIVDLSSELEIDGSLEDFDFSLAADVPDEKVVDPVESEEILEETESFDFDFDSLLLPTDTKTSIVQDSDVSDLTDMDELETKIDLAKAYIDMGDIEAAKKIADEVLEKGNEGQKKTAKAIVDQLK